MERISAGQERPAGGADESSAGERRVLCVGLVCLDIINVVDQFPLEDSDSRCVSQRWQRGGNASNSCSVLSLLGSSCSFMGSLSPGPVSDFIRDDFRKFRIDVSLVTEHAQCELPASIVIGNRRTGSRTILHMNRNLPDASLDDFRKVDLSCFHWVHFEGRNAAEQVQMIQQVALFNASVPDSDRVCVSVEIEKTREELYQLFPLGDVVFVSKDVAQSLGFHSAQAAVTGLYPRVRPGSTLICAWAELGADANKDGVLFHADAFPPEKLVDTLGAGDTFNAAVIHTLSRGTNPPAGGALTHIYDTCAVTGGGLQEALSFGCRVAGAKCGFHGYEGIAKKFGPNAAQA